MSRTLARAGAVLVAVLAAYLVVRAVVEVAIVDPGAPHTYRTDWGGPSYAGVLAVHCIPGVLGALYLAWFVRGARRRR